jgi:hypothetical protein
VVRQWAESMRMLGAVGLAMLLQPQALAHAVEADRARVMGRALGLADEETGEVIDIWVEFFRESRWVTSWSWPDVRRALINRAMGDEWRPPRRDGTWL